MVSFRPSLAVQSGLLEDVDVLILECGFVLWDYNGTQQPGPALQCNFMDLEGKVHQQYFSAGDKEYFVPSDDNSTLTQVGTKAGLSNSTNFMKFMESIVNCGFPEDQLDGPITVLNGLELHLIRKIIERKGLVQNARPGEKEKKPTGTLLAEKIHRFPWDTQKPSMFSGITPIMPKQPGTPAPAAPPVAPVASAIGRPSSIGKPAGIGATGAPLSRSAPPVATRPLPPAPQAPASSGAQGFDDELAMEVASVLIANGGKITKARLGPALFQQIAAENPNKQSMLKRVFDVDFLESGGIGGGQWTFDGGTLTAVA